LNSGWRFATEDGEAPGENVTPDPLHSDVSMLRELYFKTDDKYGGRFTVPALWDKKTGRIVNNESADIIRMLYTEFDSILPEKYQNVVLLPKALEKDIDETNSWTYDDINNGVYKSGFAT
jgi:glutathionyl-hydroquinone reductase